MDSLLDHGLPIVALKEQRREMVIGLVGHAGPVPRELIRDLADLHATISALEAVSADLDEEMSSCFGGALMASHIAN